VRLSRVIAGVTLVAVSLGCSDPSPDSSATYEVFLETCAPGRVPLEVRVCECAYDRIVDSLDPGELDDLDRRLRDDPGRLPAAVSEAVLECAAAPLGVD
jgi:hypothetical protein